MPDGPGVRSHGQQYLQYNEVRDPFVSVSDVNQVGGCGAVYRLRHFANSIEVSPDGEDGMMERFL